MRYLGRTVVSPTIRRWLGPALDIAAVVAIVAAGRALLGPDPAPAGAPFWARGWDLIIFGPDAGAWAANAWAIHDGRFADIDPHRLPTWPMIVAAVMKFKPDVALAGHLVNHVLQALMPLAIWGLARLSGSRGTAFAAGFAAAMLAPNVLASQRFGIDPTVAAIVPITLLAGWASGRSIWFAPIGGAIAALCGVAHLTTLAFPIPAFLILLFLGQPGWRRWASAALWLLAAWLTIQWVTSWYPALPSQFVANVFAEGIAPEHHGSADLAADSQKSQAAVEILKMNAPRALDDTLRFILQYIRPAWFPWSLALVLPWLGVVGPIDRNDVRGSVLRGLGLGLPLLSCLLPVVAFHAAQAPARYSENLLPIAALLLVRGAMVVPSLVDLVIARWVPKWPAVFVVTLAAAWAWTSFQAPRIIYALQPPRIEELLPQAVGTALREHFPTGVGAVCAYRESLGYGGWLFCPNATCPFQESEDSFVACVDIMRKECAGTGDIPYVVFPNPRADLQWPARTAMDRWVTTKLEPVAQVQGGGGHATIYAIPRSGPPGH